MTDGERFNGQVGCLILGCVIGLVWAVIVAWVNGGRLW
jgi:hypothetical protein